ncbi:MAG: diguanylate cyclase [Alphaproteobacteria bacterium]
MNRNTELPPNQGIDLRSIIGTFPGPAILLSIDGQVIAANSAGGAVADGLNRGLDSQVRDLAREAARDGAVKTCSVLTSQRDSDGAVDFTLLPVQSSPGVASYVIALGRKAGLEKSLVGALVASRQMFRDLVECSSDFAWETKPDGTFSFVSSRGALGYAASDLVGTAAARLVVDAARATTDPFTAREPIEAEELWLKDASGGHSCVSVSSRPVFSKDRQWLGNRGVCKDVTVEKERQEALETAELKHQLIGDVVDAMRNEVEPQHMLGAAARATANVLGARYCWIVRAKKDGGFTGAIQFAGPEGPPPRPVVEAVRLQMKDGDEDLFVKTDESTLHVLINLARYRDQINGAICVARDDENFWDETDRSLLSGVANHLGIAFAQIENGELLEELSRTDELTQLFNRRAFSEEVGLRLRALRRASRKASLLFIDLDNFKRVNDVHGHTRGDEALVFLARLLTSTSRVGDIVARLGGDEFAMWLEDTDEGGAAAKATSLLEAAKSLKQFSGDPDHTLGLSIGVAVTDPSSAEPLDVLVTRADEAMYRAKRAGKGRYAVSSFPEPDEAETGVC